VEETQKDSRAEADMVDYSGFYTDRTAALHKLKAPIDPADEQDFDQPLANLRADAEDILLEKLMLKRESLMTTAALTAANYPAALTSTLAAGSTWLDANGDVEGNSATAASAIYTSCGKAPNAAAMSWTTFRKIIAAPSIVDRIKYGMPQAAQEEVIRNLMGVQFLHICKARYNSANEGAADVIADVWDDSVLYYVKNSSPTPKQMRFGAQYIRTQLYSREYEAPQLGSDKPIIMKEMGLWYLLAAGGVVSSSDGDFIAGYLLKNAV
jgi:hypothetical protein